ncbi:GGDEF domain-containing protein [Ochrobactrum daejeonense]|nr:GGDEF domain-containing protein [Brucella daejeonensis]
MTLALSILAVVVTDKLSSLEKEKATDHLSGLLNRRGFGDAAARIFRLRPSGPIGILLLDIDHFKRINDRYGHHAGDLVIGGVARLIAEMTSSVDGVSCRLGGKSSRSCFPTRTASALQCLRRESVAPSNSRNSIQASGTCR